MPTNTTRKLAMGHDISTGVTAVTSKLATRAREAFMQAYTALAQAEAAVKAAATVVELATQRCQRADEEQGRAALELATKMSGDGFGRHNPFKSFNITNPSKTCNLAQADEAVVLIALAARVIVHHKSSPATKQAAAAVERAARAMHLAEAARSEALNRRAAAIAHREGEVHTAYTVALSNLRAAIKYVDSVEQTAHYRNVFPRVAGPKNKAKPVSS